MRAERIVPQLPVPVIVGALRPFASGLRLGLGFSEVVADSGVAEDLSRWWTSYRPTAWTLARRSTGDRSARTFPVRARPSLGA